MEEFVETVQSVPVAVVEDEVVADELQSVDLRLEDLLLLLALVGCTHQPAGLTHWVHRARHLLLVFVQRFCAVVRVFVVQQERLQLVESEYNQEVEGNGRDVAHVEIGHVDAGLSHGPELLSERKGHLGEDEPREEGVDPGHGRDGGQHHHDHTLHVVHHAALHCHHIVGGIHWRFVPVHHQIASFRLAEEPASAVEGLLGQQHVLLGQVVTFGYDQLLLGLLILGLLDGFLGSGVGTVECKVEAEELDEAGHVDDGQEHPRQHAFVQQQLPHYQLIIIKPKKHTPPPSNQPPTSQIFMHTNQRKQRSNYDQPNIFSVISIEMKTTARQYHSKWPTDLSFYTFPAHKEILVPKEELQTYADLLEFLEIETGIKMENINLAINYTTISYSWNTPIYEIDIKKEDLCHVLRKTQCKNQREKDEASRKQKQIQKKAQDRIKARLENPEYKKLVDTVNSSPKRLQLFKELCREYSRDECLYAVCDHGNDVNKARNALAQGECKLKVQRRVFDEERAYLKEFLNHKDRLEIQKLLRENNNPIIFIKIMQKLYEKYPKFKEVQPKHQAYVQKFLFGKTLEPEEDDEPDEEGLASDVSKALWMVDKRKKPRQLMEEDETRFRNALKSHKKKEEIKEIFKISHNNIEWAEALLKSDQMDTSEKITSLCLKKSNRINLVMHFLSHPKFHKTTQTLRGDVKKTEAFITFIQQKVKANATLSLLIKQYREQAIILLSGVNISKEKQSKNDAPELAQEPALPLEEQKKERTKIEGSYNKELFDILKRKLGDPVLAASSLRATGSNLEEMIPYLALGGINRTFDFCPAGDKPQQLYIYKKWKKQKELLKKLKTSEAYLSWLAQIKQTRPLMFDMIIRNKSFFDKMIQGDVDKKK